MRMSDWSSDVCSSDLPIPRSWRPASVQAYARSAASMSIFAIAAGIPDDIGAGYPLGPFFSSIAELVPARSRAARTRRSARRYALPQRPDEGKHLSQTSHYVGRPRPPPGRWGPTIFFGGSRAALLLRSSEERRGGK